MKYNYQTETIERAAALNITTVSGVVHREGLRHHEPLIVILDSLIRYAKAHEARFESKLSEDYVLGPAWLSSLTGVRRMLDGEGAVAHEKGYTTDSKDNGACEAMFWDAMAIAGFTEADL